MASVATTFIPPLGPYVLLPIGTSYHAPSAPDFSAVATALQSQWIASWQTPASPHTYGELGLSQAGRLPDHLFQGSLEPIVCQAICGLTSTQPRVSAVPGAWPESHPTVISTAARGFPKTFRRTSSDNKTTNHYLDLCETDSKFGDSGQSLTLRALVEGAPMTSDTLDCLFDRGELTEEGLGLLAKRIEAMELRDAIDRSRNDTGLQVARKVPSRTSTRSSTNSEVFALADGTPAEDHTGIPCRERFRIESESSRSIHLLIVPWC